MRLFILSALWVLVALPTQALQNQLAEHPSPYLRMHGKDPVHWQNWGPEVLKRAQREGKLIFVSVGYFSCHWCHVMQRESYQNLEIAKILNAHFIPVKIDRELHPALDTRLIEFVQATRNYSGWPLNVFITPEGFPLVGLVYLPAKDFLKLVTLLDVEWKKSPARLKQQAEAVAKALEKSEPSLGPNLPKGLGEQLSRSYVLAALKEGDDLKGGFGQKSKFPNVPQMMTVLDALQAKSNPRLEKFARLTLDQMASQGLSDLVRGGFFRYTVDAQWKTPHFEKMLYDNAQLAELYWRAAQVLGSKQYSAVARRTLDFMIGEMLHADGALLASLSALDLQGVEGGYYLWHDQELNKHLAADDLSVLRRLWGMDKAPPLSEGHLPVLAFSFAQIASEQKRSVVQVQSAHARGLQILLAAQNKRHLPKDDKLLASWNGMALRAFSLGAGLESGGEYHKTATSIRNYLIKYLWDGTQVHRARSRLGGLGEASLEDYAQLAYGLYSYSTLGDSKRDLLIAEQVAEQAWRRFYTDKGWRISESSMLKFGTEESLLSDGAIASSSAILIRASLLIGAKTNNLKMVQRALSALNVSHKTLNDDPYWFATHIRTLRQWQAGVLD